jgi:hypothetical protein
MEGRVVAPWICRYLWAASLGMWYMPASKPAVWPSLPQLRCSSRRSAVPVGKLGLYCLVCEVGERASAAENALPAGERAGNGQGAGRGGG